MKHTDLRHGCLFQAMFQVRFSSTCLRIITAVFSFAPPVCGPFKRETFRLMSTLLDQGEVSGRRGRESSARLYSARLRCRFHPLMRRRHFLTNAALLCAGAATANLSPRHGNAARSRLQIVSVDAFPVRLWADRGRGPLPRSSPTSTRPAGATGGRSRNSAALLS